MKCCMKDCSSRRSRFDAWMKGLLILACVTGVTFAIVVLSSLYYLWACQQDPSPKPMVVQVEVSHED